MTASHIKAPAPRRRETFSSVVVARCGPGERAQHLFAPCLHVHSSGQLLLICRWDEHGADEGDATNTQALYFSRDEGLTWTLTGDGPLLTGARGSSFPTASSITHAWIFEDRRARTWLYYTINQPFTWGEGRPDRSTGGGEIRRQEIAWDGRDWITRGASAIVWGFQQPLPDGHGGVARDIRVVSWNGLVRQGDGSLVMPVGGRSSVPEPRGEFSKLDRVWVLISRDDGGSWREAYFVGGGDSLCLAEPTLVATVAPNELICLLRVQYGTGNQLHRAVSRDGGRTWSAPVPTGLPQANTQGVKPFLLRLADGRYALIQTNEHEVIERTNLAVFLTEEAGLHRDEWPQLRTLQIGNRRGWWPGCCYGWLTQARDGALLASYPCHDAGGGRLYFARLPLATFTPGATLEPNGVRDELGDDLPCRTGPQTHDGESSWSFSNARSRLVAPDYGRHCGAVKFSLQLAALSDALFRVARFTARNGRDEVCALFVAASGWSVRMAAGLQPLAFPVPAKGQWCEVRLTPAPDRIIVQVGCASSGVTTVVAPTGLELGGAAAPAPVEIYLGDFVFLSA